MQNFNLPKDYTGKLVSKEEKIRYGRGKVLAELAGGKLFASFQPQHKDQLFRGSLEGTLVHQIAVLEIPVDTIIPSRKTD